MKMQVNAHPWWGSVGLRAVTLPYPLKTSHEKGQFKLFRGIPCSVRADFHVAFTRSRWCLLRLILVLVAMVWSSVSLKFIARNHCFWTCVRGSGGEGYPCWRSKGHEVAEWGMQRSEQ